MNDTRKTPAKYNNPKMLNQRCVESRLSLGPRLVTASVITKSTVPPEYIGLITASFSWELHTALPRSNSKLICFTKAIHLGQ